MGFLLMVLFIIALPFIFIFAFFAPIILVPALLVGSIIYLFPKAVVGSSILFDRLNTYSKSLSISTFKGYLGAGSRGNLENLRFDDQNFSNLNFSGASFLNTTFLKSNFENSELGGANFHDTDLCGVNMKGCKTFNTDFTGAIFDKMTKLPFSFEVALREKMVYSIA